MDKQAIERAAISYSDRYSFLEDTTVVRAAFIAGAELNLPEWIPVSAGPPKIGNEGITSHCFCLVFRNQTISILAYNLHESCWDQEDMDDYECDFDAVSHYLPLHSLPKP